MSGCVPIYTMGPRRARAAVAAVINLSISCWGGLLPLGDQCPFAFFRQMLVPSQKTRGSVQLSYLSPLMRRGGAFGRPKLLTLPVSCKYSLLRTHLSGLFIVNDTPCVWGLGGRKVIVTGIQNKYIPSLIGFSEKHCARRRSSVWIDGRLNYKT